MFNAASYEEPLLCDLDGTKHKKPISSEKIPASLQKTTSVSIPNLDETQIVRHFHRLAHMNYSIDTGIYPLGSCTMKYNPKITEEIAGWDAFSDLHPYQDESTVQGTLHILHELQEMLCEITGMNAFSLQPAAGAHGEFLGMLLTKAYHESRNDPKRTEVILPDTSHGTNPASVKIAGYDLVEIPSNDQGTVDLDALESVLSDKTACFMLTNPNTLGIFESDILTIAKKVHQAGGLLYYDGANMNANMGHVRPGDMGFDIVHLNLHKTFSTPHGGGGPGSGPVGVTTSLEPFLPLPRIIKKQNQYSFSYDHPQSIGKIRSFYGNISVLIKAYIYILMMGGDGLKKASDIAVLNANYMKDQLVSDSKYDLPYASLRKHEFVLSCETLLKEKGVKALDVAKRLMDYGFHPPTIYFPLIVKEALMIEPTETESKKELDNYILALKKIADEDPEIIKSAPHHTTVHRVDEVEATRNPILTWNME